MCPWSIISSLRLWLIFGKPAKHLGNLQLGDFEHWVCINGGQDQDIKSNRSPIMLNLGGNRHDTNFYKTKMDQFQKLILIQLKSFASLCLAAIARLHHRIHWQKVKRNSSQHCHDWHYERYSWYITFFLLTSLTHLQTSLAADQTLFLAYVVKTR